MNTAHRLAARVKHQQLPKFWRPKIDADQKITCQIIHWDLLERFTNGTADAAILWDWIETGFTYTQMMNLLVRDGIEFTDEAITAINDQIGIYEAVIARYKNCGRVGFSASELLIARAAANVMDAVLELDRHGIADAAARWSVAQMQALRTTGKCAPIGSMK